KRRTDFSKAIKETRDRKMIINESDGSDDSENDEGADSSDIVMQEADNHYMESQKSNDGFIRGQGNKIKFKNKKNNRDDLDIDDIEPIDAIASRNQKKRKLNQGKLKNNNNNNNKVIVIGNEYKAKNAGGDLKKKG